MHWHQVCPKTHLYLLGMWLTRISLAYMELFLALAHFVHRFDVQLVNTKPDDVRLVRDMNMGYTKRGPLKVFGWLSSAKVE